MNSPIVSHRSLARLALCALLGLTPAIALADRGGGSIRGASRAEPAPHAEPAHAAPARAEPARAEPTRGEPARGAPERAQPARVEPNRGAPDRGPVDRHEPVRAEPGRVERGRPEPVRVEPARRDWDDHDVEIVHGGGFAHGDHGRYARGERFHDLPHHILVPYNNVSYYYDDDGNFYLPQDGEYVDVQPPVGAIVPALPPGAETISGGPTTYYYVDGVFYVPSGGGYAVVNPPPGIAVPDLPPGANQVIVNGNVVYQFGGFNYQPSIQDGVTSYVVTPM